MDSNKYPHKTVVILRQPIVATMANIFKTLITGCQNFGRRLEAASANDGGLIQWIRELCIYYCMQNIKLYGKVLSIV